MDKDDFVKTLKDFRKDINDLTKACQKATGNQVQSKTLLDGLETLATRWFEHIDPTLRTTFHLDEEVLNRYREPFGKTLELSGANRQKELY